MTTWLDVTTIWGWKRPAVGVVRVESECFRFFSGLGDSACRFCIFDGRSGDFVEVQASEVHTRIRVANGSEKAETQQGQRKRGFGGYAKLKQTIRDRLEDYPASIRIPILKSVRGPRKIYRMTKQLGQKHLAPLVSSTDRDDVHAQPPAIVQKHPFVKGDTYVSMGLDWDQKNLEGLYELKKSVGLSVLLFAYDLIPVYLPHLCVGDVSSVFSRYFVDLAWCADRILCISKCTQKDLSNFLENVGAPKPPSAVIRLGSDVAHFKGDLSAPVKQACAKPFLLFVSTIERRKNHEAIYKAYLLLLQRGRRDLPRVVFVGMNGWGISDFLADLRFDPRVKDTFVLLHHVTDSELSYLYQKASFTLYPSLYEGWGLPLAESLAYGKFALASNAASLPEVGGDLVDYIEPLDVRSWADKIAYYLDHPAELEVRNRRIVEKYRPASWESCAKSVFEHAQKLNDDMAASLGAERQKRGAP